MTRYYWDYSDQYGKIVSEGSLKPPPGLGSPSFVWHLAIWQRFTVNQALDLEVRGPGDRYNPSAEQHPLHTAFEVFNWHDQAFFREVSTFLKGLQEKGRVLGVELEELKFTTPTLYDTPPTTYRFGVCEPQSLSFTLWWQDGAHLGKPNQRQKIPSPDDLRVRVTAQTHQDHVTISFYIDAAKPFNRSQLYSAKDVTGARRARINRYLEIIREVGKTQIESGAIEHESIPERNVSQDHARALKEAAEYFYEGIWDEFRAAFDLEEAPKGMRLEGECFADFRGAMLYVPGIRTDLSEKREELYSKLREGMGVSAKKPLPEEGGMATTGIGPFDVFDNESGEPNTVIKAYWPFIRRMVPWADYRDFTASGIITWRALFITALGAAGKFYGSEESISRDEEVPSKDLNKAENDGEINSKAPIRFLVLHKGEPHRRQIGRMVERITAVGTMRLFALKNLATIENANTHIRIIGRELDGILMDWTRKRADIDKEFVHDMQRYWKEEERKKRSLYRRITRFWDQMLWGRTAHVESLEYLRIVDDKVKRLSQLIYESESKLIELGARLDDVGQRGAGRLLYLISRAEYHINEFERMAETLEVGNIDGWINYRQFVARGLQPSYNLISRTGERLSALKARLRIVTETIQTSALIVETEATRANTQTLKNILATMWTIKWTFLTIGLIIIAWGISKWAGVLAFFQKAWESLPHIPNIII